MTFEDAVTGSKTLAELATGGGGLYGINVETLAGDKTLTPNTDKIYQYLDEGGLDRIITLDTASATLGDRFVIRHNGAYNDTHYLEVKQAATSLDEIYAGAIKEFVFNGTNWISRGIGTGENDDKKQNISIGAFSQAYSLGTAIGGKGAFGCKGHAYGVAIGPQAYGYNYGAAIGYQAQGYGNAVAVGYRADAFQNGVAVGYQANTNQKKNSIALGYNSKCERIAETSININGDDTDQENNVVQGRWERELAGGAGATEIFCGGQANARFTVRASSHLAFRITVIARDNVANEGAMYTFEGLIKRDGANNTVLSVCNTTIVHEDDATWDCAVTADDTNEALIITCTGDGTNITQWAAVMNGVETHF